MCPKDEEPSSGLQRQMRPVSDGERTKVHARKETKETFLHYIPKQDIVAVKVGSAPLSNPPSRGYPLCKPHYESEEPSSGAGRQMRSERRADKARRPLKPVRVGEFGNRPRRVARLDKEKSRVFLEGNPIPLDGPYKSGPASQANAQGVGEEEFL
jgi:hypothetical protein